MNKRLVLMGLAGLFGLSGALNAVFKGSAIRRIVNYTPKPVTMFDSNSKFFYVPGHTVNQYGAVIPGRADFHGKNDPEIKQDPSKPFNLSIQYPSYHVYLLSDYDWRIWTVKSGKRTNTVLYDKQALKAQYAQYRRDAALSPLSVAASIAGSATGGKISGGDLSELADKPPTKDVRLYIMPDGSIIFTTDDPNSTTPEEIVAHLIEEYKLSPKEDYRYLYQEIMGEVTKSAAFSSYLLEQQNK